MTRERRYGRPKATRFRLAVDQHLEKFCEEKKISPSRVIQEAVECFLFNPKCQARKRRIF